MRILRDSQAQLKFHVSYQKKNVYILYHRMQSVWCKEMLDTEFKEVETGLN